MLLFPGCRLNRAVLKFGEEAMACGPFPSITFTLYTHMFSYSHILISTTLPQNCPYIYRSIPSYYVSVIDIGLSFEYLKLSFENVM